MQKKLIILFVLAIKNIRSRIFHTFLSILGIVIGVAALVAILSLIDGMEKFAREQISTTTSLEAIILQSDAQERVNGVRIEKDTFAFINYADFGEMRKKLSHAHDAYYVVDKNKIIYSSDSKDTLAAVLRGSASELNPDLKLLAGRQFDESEIANKESIAVINTVLADLLFKDKKPARILNQTFSFEGKRFKIIGVAKVENARSPIAYIPATHFSNQETKSRPPVAVIRAKDVEKVLALQDEISAWVKEKYGKRESDIRIFTYEGRLKQMAQAFLLFRVIMGLIVGISVLVGGIGVMNVLLISVNERTSEIGIRKAVGANKRDIIFQFLAESVTISTVGSFCGLLVGVLGTLIIIPIVKALTEAPFQAAFTWDTFFIISFLALLIGIIFGTYPALRASRLDPVEAIRRE